MQTREPPCRRRRRLLACALVALGLPVVLASPAGATWSIVAVDPATGEVGGAIASCVDLPSSYYGDDGLLKNVVVVAGTGAGITQARVNLDAADRIRADLEAGLSAERTIADVTGSFDAGAAERQHGVVRLDDPASPGAFTGSETLEWSGHRTGNGVSAQGNILVSEDVVAKTLDAFERQDGDELAERLVGALLAGSRAGGDSRCEQEQSALFAQVAVLDRGGALDVRTVRVGEGDGRNPVELLSTGELSGPADTSTDGVSWWAVLLALGIGMLVAAGLVKASRRRRGRPTT